MILGQCISAVERNLEGDESYKEINDQNDSIGLMKLLEKICYNYRSHEYTPLGAWDAMDRLSVHRQPDNVHEVKHYESFKLMYDLR